MTKIATVRLLEIEKKLDNFRAARGLNYSQAIRLIIKEYFEQNMDSKDLRGIENGMINDLIEEMERIKSDLKELKSTTETALKMTLVIGNADDDIRENFKRFFPQYFKR